MSLQPTQREAATGGLDPFQIQASTDFGALMEDASVIDTAPGQPGAVTVRRTPGQINYAEKLTDAIAQYEQPPGVTVTVRHGRKTR
jgi:hypothetical protein